MGWRLTADELALTKEKIDALNAKAEKRGLSGRLEVISEEKEVTYDVAGIPVTEIVYETSVTGEPPKYNGWSFLASLDWIDTGVIVNAAPGADLVDRDKLEPGKCDHCGINRYRKMTYVVSDGTKQLQVGSSCINDFLGWSGSVAFLSDDNVEREVLGIIGSGEPVYTTESILAIAWACVTEFGYVKSSESHSTRAAVMDVLNPKETKWNREIKARIRPVAKDALPMAAKLIEFVVSDEFNGDSDYVTNLKTLCASETTTARFIGYLASVPQAYARHLERSFIRERQRAQLTNEWIGEKKERRTFSVKIKAISWVEDIYSYYPRSKPIYTLLTDTGHTLKWFASNDDVLGEEVTPENEDFFPITATVVGFEEWNGFKSTKVNRCKKV